MRWWLAFAVAETLDDTALYLAEGGLPLLGEDLCDLGACLPLRLSVGVNELVAETRGEEPAAATNDAVPETGGEQ